MTIPTPGTKIVDTTNLSKDFTKLIKRYSKMGDNNALSLNCEHIAGMLKQLTNLSYRKGNIVLFVYTDVEEEEEMLLISTPLVQCKMGMGTPISHVLKNLAMDANAGEAAAELADAIMQVINHFNSELHHGNLDPDTLDDKCYIGLQKCQAK